MSVLEFIYKNLFTSDEKIKQHCSILVVSYDDPDYFNYIEINKKEIRKKKLIITTNHDTDYKSMTFDFIIFNFLFSTKSRFEIENEFAVYRKYLKNTGICMFIDELNTTEFNTDYHPLSITRNILHKIPFFNFKRVVSMQECYEILRYNSFSIVDCNRIFTIDTIPSYPQEFFVISCQFIFH